MTALAPDNAAAGDLSDPDSFQDAFRRLVPRALASAQGVLHEIGAAEEVVQDVFAALWRRPGAYDPRRGDLGAYVAMVARSRALDRHRSDLARRRALEWALAEPCGAPAAEGADEPLMRRERSRDVLDALADLPDEQRAAVLLSRGLGLTSHEIAQASGVPVGTAKSRVRAGSLRALAALEAAGLAA